MVTRLLYPIRIDRPEGLRFSGADSSVLEALTTHEIGLGERGTFAAWELQRLSQDKTRPRVPDLYYEELLSQVRDVLFRDRGERTGRLLRVPRTTLTRMLNGPVQLWPEGRSAWLSESSKPLADQRTAVQPIIVNAVTDIELFVTGFDVGVVSLTVELTSKDDDALSLDQIKTLLYYITQRREFRKVSISLTHPEDDLSRLSRIPKEVRGNIASPLHRDSAPLPERLGKQGGEIQLSELLRFLLPGSSEDDNKHGVRFVDAHQSQLANFSVIRFDSSVEFKVDAPHPELTPALSAITQLEEVDHAGADLAESTVPYRVLNSKHVAAVGSLGSAHFVADQIRENVESGFNVSRVRLVATKYFTDFLVAYLQDQYLQKVAQDCCDLVEPLAGSLNASCALAVGNLRAEVLEFDALCYVTRVSAREAHNQYYDLAQEGLHVRRSMRDVDHQLEAIDALCRHQSELQLNQEIRDLGRAQHAQQSELVKVNTSLRDSGEQRREHQGTLVEVVGNLRESIRAIESMQNKIEWVELFLVGVYSVYLTNYLGENFSFPHTYIGVSIIVIASIASAVTAILLEPWSHATSEMSRKRDGIMAALRTFLGWRQTVALIAVVFASYITLGFYVSSLNNEVPRGNDGHGASTVEEAALIGKDAPDSQTSHASEQGALGEQHQQTNDKANAESHD